MEEFSRKVDVVKLISYSNDLVEVLKDKRDIHNLAQCLDHSKSLRCSCDADFNQVQSLIEAEYQKKIDACKKKTETAKSEIAAEAEIQNLQKELEEELEKERAFREELRSLSSDLNDLGQHMISIEEQRQTLKKLEKDELKEQMKLSMYASVTNIVPNIDNESKISGYIVDRDKKVIDKFEYDLENMTRFDTCQSIWKLINL